MELKNQNSLKHSSSSKIYGLCLSFLLLKGNLLVNIYFITESSTPVRLS